MCIRLLCETDWKIMNCVYRAENTECCSDYMLCLHLFAVQLSRVNREGKEFCEHFAEIFTVMDPRDFADVFSVRLDVLYGAMKADQDAPTVAAHLVQSSSVGRTFNAMLAEFLNQHKLQLLADPSNKVRTRA